MTKVALGDTGQKVSALCLGTMRYGATVDEETSQQLLDQYVEAGGSFLDTANIYGNRRPGLVDGGSETVLGRWMADRGNRDDLFLASKVGFDYAEIPTGLKASVIQTECEKSLRRLGTDVIDLYYAHTDDRTTPLDETMEAFGRLVGQGKVRFVGASNYRAWRLEEAAAVSKAGDWPTFCCVQQRHTYLLPAPGADFGRQTSSNEDLLDYCSNRPLTLLAYSPLLHGIYDDETKEIPEPYVGDHAGRQLTALRRVAASRGVSPNTMVYAWMMQSEVIPLMSASRAEHMSANLSALDLVLTDDEMTDLRVS